MSVCKAELQFYFLLHHLMSASKMNLLPLRFYLFIYLFRILFPLLNLKKKLGLLVLETITHPISPCYRLRLVGLCLLAMALGDVGHFLTFFP